MIQKRPAALQKFRESVSDRGEGCKLGEKIRHEGKTLFQVMHVCLPWCVYIVSFFPIFFPVIGFFQSSRHAFFRPLHKRLHASRIFSSQSSLHVMTKCQDPPHASPKRHSAVSRHREHLLPDGKPKRQALLIDPVRISFSLRHVPRDKPEILRQDQSRRLRAGT